MVLSQSGNSNERKVNCNKPLSKFAYNKVQLARVEFFLNVLKSAYSK